MLKQPPHIVRVDPSTTGRKLNGYAQVPTNDGHNGKPAPVGVKS
jgi:hypothetical protein